MNSKNKKKTVRLERQEKKGTKRLTGVEWKANAINRDNHLLVRQGTTHQDHQQLQLGPQ